MLTSFVQNLALLALAGLVAFSVARRSTIMGRTQEATLGFMLGAVAALVILAPATGPGGATLDARAGPVLFAGFLGGPLAGVVAAAIASAARAIVGGPFVASAAICLFAYASVGVAVARFFRRKALDPPSKPEITALALIGAPSAASALLLIPSEMAWSWTASAYPMIVAMNLCAVAITGFAIREVFEALSVNRRLASASAELETRLEAERAAGAAKSRFLENLSHELRTPLNAVIGLTEIIEAMGPAKLGEKRAREALAGLKSSGLHLHDLVEDLLTWLESEREDAPPFRLEPHSLAAACWRAVAACGELSAERDVRVEVEAAPDLFAAADRGALDRCLSALLSNAVAASPAGAVVTMRSVVGREGVALETLDRGGGVPAEIMDRLGEPFLRAKDRPHRTGGGLGLGLAIAFILAKRLGGNLSLAPRSGGGTCARLSLRAADSARGAETARAGFAMGGRAGRLASGLSAIPPR